MNRKSPNSEGMWQYAAWDKSCDRTLAIRLAYECENYRVLMEDWLAFLEIYDLTAGDQKAIAPIARKRQRARLGLMAHCEQVKEQFICRAAAMRNHSIFMQCFADIAAYIENTDTPQLDLWDITPIMSKENRLLR